MINYQLYFENVNNSFVVLVVSFNKSSFVRNLRGDRECVWEVVNYFELTCTIIIVVVCLDVKMNQKNEQCK